MTNYHRGIDIDFAEGSILTSNVEGVVECCGDSRNSDYHSSYGKIVVIRDTESNKHLYAHLDEVVVKKGDYINKGTELGVVGSTGRTDKIHLHYEVCNEKGELLDAVL